MNAKSFKELQLLALIAPSQPNWPNDTTYWQLLNCAVLETRERCGKLLETIDEISADPRLTAEAKREERAKAAGRTLASLDGSSTVRHAEEAVAGVQAQWAAKIAKTIAKPTDAADVAIAMQIRDRVANMKDAERMKWLIKHGDDPTVAAAVLSAPRALSNLTDSEWALVQHKVEVRALSAEGVEEKSSTERALAELQRGARAATARIATAGGVHATAHQTGSAPKTNRAQKAKLATG